MGFAILMKPLKIDDICRFLRGVANKIVKLANLMPFG